MKRFWFMLRHPKLWYVEKQLTKELQKILECIYTKLGIKK